MRVVTVIGRRLANVRRWASHVFLQPASVTLASHPAGAVPARGSESAC